MLRKKGCENLERHISNLRKFGIPVVVAVNTFATDTENEINAVVEETKKAGAFDVIPTSVFIEGGKGGLKLAESLLKATEQPAEFKFLYPDDMGIKEKIDTICKEIYGASEVVYLPKVLNRIKKFEKDGLGKLSICMAKTHLSLSDNPNIKGDPTRKPYSITIDEIRISAGAGFIYPIAGSMLTMPGLPPVPAANGIDIDENGKISGLF
jgi:formyltetrahydrofolate synthetase